MENEPTVLPAPVAYKERPGVEGIDAKALVAEAKGDPLAFFQDRITLVVLALFGFAALAMGLCLSGVPALAQAALFGFAGVAALFVAGILAMAAIGTKRIISERRSRDC